MPAKAQLLRPPGLPLTINQLSVVQACFGEGSGLGLASSFVLTEPLLPFSWPQIFTLINTQETENYKPAAAPHWSHRTPPIKGSLVVISVLCLALMSLAAFLKKKYPHTQPTPPFLLQNDMCQYFLAWGICIQTADYKKPDWRWGEHEMQWENGENCSSLCTVGKLWHRNPSITTSTS